MKNGLRVLACVCLLLAGVAPCGAQGAGQPPPTNAGPPPPDASEGPPAPLAPVREVGKAQVFYHKETAKAGGATSAKTAVTLYEKRQGEKTVEFLVLNVHARVPGPKLVRPKNVLVEFTSFTSDTPSRRFSDEQSRVFVVTIDGRSSGRGVLRPGIAVEWSKTSRTESAEILVSFAAFEHMARARRLKLRIGPDEYALEAERLSPLLNLLAAVEQ